MTMKSSNCCLGIFAHILKGGDELLFKELSSSMHFLASVGVPVLRIGKCVMLFDRSLNSHNINFLSNTLILTNISLSKGFVPYKMCSFIS
jgi:hypothetical protein